MIIAFGDSTTAPREGVKVYTVQLARRFQDTQLSFINRGLPGDTTMAARARFDEDVRREIPKVLILQFGINDSAVDVWKTPPETESRVSLGEYERNLRFFIEEMLAMGKEVILMTPNQLRWTSETRALYGRSPYDVSDDHGFTRILESYAEVVRRLAREYTIPLVDVFALYDLWEKEASRGCSELMLDGMHPNTLGHTLVADAIETILRGRDKSL